MLVAELPDSDRVVWIANHSISMIISIADMNYLVAVLPDRLKTEAAYSALAKELPSNQIDILGEGYQSADEYGLIDPNAEARKIVKREIYWLVPFGFIAGYAFNWLTSIAILPSFPPLGNHVIGGFFGAVAGILGAYLTGGTIGFTVASGDALPYRNRLNAGKYLIIVTGTGELIRQATLVLNQFEPENIQGYSEPRGV
jgi:hypothetical protein